MKGIYIEACEDWVNLDHVAYIEFRNQNGNIPPRLRNGVIDIVQISQAYIWFRGQEGLRRGQVSCYMESSARELYTKVRETSE